MANSDRICSVENCGKPAKRRGLCIKHYKRLLRHGDPTAGRTERGSVFAWLMEHITYTGEDCLPWPFSRNDMGYGQYRDPETGKLVRAARFMCEAVNGPPPTQDHQAAHSCGKGNDGCTNPKHLRWATLSENQMDRVEHGTSNRGERQWNSKLKPDDVQLVRKMAKTMSKASIAAQLGVNRITIHDIVTGRTWGWLAD